MIGAGGATLSGGQRQRVGLARAIYKKPSLIVLDEPNSNLDEEGEKALVNAILNMKQKGSTIILITHRPNILNVVDNIAVLANGALSAYGKKDEVLGAIRQQAQQAKSQSTPKPNQPQMSMPKMTKPGE